MKLCQQGVSATALPLANCILREHKSPVISLCFCPLLNQTTSEASARSCEASFTRISSLAQERISTGGWGLHFSASLSFLQLLVADPNHLVARQHKATGTLARSRELKSDMTTVSVAPALMVRLFLMVEKRRPVQESSARLQPGALAAMKLVCPRLLASPL